MNMTPVRFHLRSLGAAVLVLGLVALPAAAQPRSNFSAHAVPATEGTFSLMASYSSESELKRGDASAGTVSITALQFGAASSSAMGINHRLQFGFDYGQFQLDRDIGSPLPDELEEFSLPLSVTSGLGAEWTGRLQFRPGVYGTSLNISGERVNMPVLALASWRRNADLTWTFGVRYDAWARHELLPLAGVNWKFAPRWEFAIGLPRTGVAWEFRPDTTLRIGASIQGGSFHVDDVPRLPGPNVPTLNATKLDYREIRAGAALELVAVDTIRVVVDAGAVVNQRFDYHRRNYRLSGSTAGYATLAIRGRF